MSLLYLISCFIGDSQNRAKIIFMQKLIRTCGFCKVFNIQNLTFIRTTANIDDVFFLLCIVITNNFKTTVFGVMLMNNYTFAKVVNITNYKKSIL
ncbi:Uncharacterised protein [Bergeyella zoohelcum]|uniref:Uncharacterized protein n=1 Tax=Bergeyella zoohelcum TaxID=1015 RepID=A0A376BZW7_9FLAO|nr:Uncharacterised protein [Bergeyella zoohelcum]